MNDVNVEDKHVKIWGEHVNIKEFLKGLFISIGILVLVIPYSSKMFNAMMILFASFKKSKGNHNVLNTTISFTELRANDILLIVGLLLVLVGFAINMVMIKPKRNIIVKDINGNDN